MSKLSAKEELFAQKVVELDNQSEALRIAYPYTRKWKEEAVWVRASSLAAKDKVKLRIADIKNRLANKEIITKERILKGLVERLDVDPIDYIEIKEGDDSKQVLYVKNLNELTKAQRQSIKSMKETRYGIELEFYSHVELVDRINKMVGFNEADKVEMNSTGSVNVEQLLKLSRK
mgnify:CR=1 FL=1